MTDINNLYNISLKDQKQEELSLGAKDISFVIRDSIYDLIPTLDIEINDPYGFWIESKVFTPGRLITFCFGLDQLTDELPCVVNYTEIKSQFSNSNLEGKLHVNLFHKSALSERKSICYKSLSPVDVVKKIFNEFNAFHLKLSKSCCPEDIIYNPYLNREDFVNQILLPRSRSNINARDPYYAFIDSKNVLHWETLSEMLSNTKKVGILISQGILESGSNNETLGINIYPFTQSIEKPYRYDREKIYFWDNNKLISTEFTPTLIPRPYHRYIKDFTILNNTNFQFQYDNNTFISEHNIDTRKSLLFDEHIVSLPYNKNITAGTLINLRAYLSDKVESTSYNDLYLVERCQHCYDCEKMFAFTNVVIGRPKANFATYLEK